MTGDDDDIPLVWLYDQDKWTQLRDPVMVDHGPPGAESWDEWLARVGYIPADHWCGPRNIVAIDEDTDAEYRWRIQFGLTANRTDVIMVKRFPDLIELLAKLAPIALASAHGQQAPPETTQKREKQESGRDW